MALIQVSEILSFAQCMSSRGTGWFYGCFEAYRYVISWRGAGLFTKRAFVRE